MRAQVLDVVTTLTILQRAGMSGNNRPLPLHFHYSYPLQPISSFTNFLKILKKNREIFDFGITISS